MSNTDKLREFGQKVIREYGRWWGIEEKDTDKFLSDLTALISEGYVSKEKHDKVLQQRDELREALRGAIGIIRTWHGIGIIDEAKEADMWRIYSSHAPEMKKLIAAIKNTEKK